MKNKKLFVVIVFAVIIVFFIITSVMNNEREVENDVSYKDERVSIMDISNTITSS